MGKLEDLDVLQKLKDSGAITPDEFEKVKNKVLADDVVDINNQIKEDVKTIDNKETIKDQVQEHDDIKDTLDNKVDTSKKGTITIKFNHLVTEIIIAILCITLAMIIIFNLQQDNQNISNSDKINTTNDDIERENENDDIVEEKNLLEQIEAIDPNNEYPVCIGEYGDYTEYWILDSEGKKIHFSDVEGFKNAIEIYKERANNTSKSNGNSNLNDNGYNTTNNNKENFVRIPDLTGMTEQEAINKAKDLNVPYKVVYREDLSYREEGIVIDQTTHSQIIRDGDGDIVAAYSLRILYHGETLAIVVNKYEERTVKFNIEIPCLVRRYKEICNEKGLTINDNNYAFDLKINNKSIYKETIKSETLEQEIKKVLTIKNEIYDDWDSVKAIERYMIFGSCNTLKESSYTGYGVFDITLTLNDVIIANDKCDLYHTLDGYSNIVTKDESLIGGCSYIDDNGYGDMLKIPIVRISAYEHGGAG